ncbi:helicase-related protein [Modestobacter sp. SYSU DS0875]
MAEKYAFREAMVRRLHDDLIGPRGGDQEVIDESPLDRYIAGVLWPSDSGTQEAVAEEPVDARDDDTAPSDPPVAQARMRFPSSAGITFTVDAQKVDAVVVRPSAAQYVPGDEVTSVGTDQLSRARGQRRVSWTRVRPDMDDVTVRLDEVGPRRVEVAPGLELYVLVRKPVDGRVTVTAALLNKQATTGGLRDESSWFQVSIQVLADAPAFVDRAMIPTPGDEDLATGALLYRNARTFASGHGCAATWEVDDANSVSFVRTTFMPGHELKRARPRRIPGVDLRMSHLATAGTPEVLETLGTIVSEYRAWISARESDTADRAVVDEKLEGVAVRHMARAGEAADRIEAGIDVLRRDPDAMRAFRLMNEAMQLQRARQDWVRNGATGEPDAGAEQAWYPFQLAFILLNLAGLNDSSHEDRDVLDLLWFPTGGGKTEAYLGLIAFTITRRRIGDPSATGVAVIMRYTLRLLTIQQFERATTLICALEYLRGQRAELGSDPFSIGLWVGGAATPNTLDDARKALNKLARGHDVDEGNPVQLLACPWCGGGLGADEYRIVKHPERHLRVACGRAGCHFSSGLPVHLVDEDVYRARPELVIGTVDKFARMAWTEKAGALFARDGRGHRPELIIQDELHLISGPLGSMVGLYETAVDAACAVDADTPFDPPTGRAKIVASTATIRRATEQVRAVFNRSAAQFPPPGIDPDLSFFAEPASSQELGDRAYIGVMAPGTSHQTLMIRVYASLLQSAQDIPAAVDTRDPYWTLMGYFGSLRVLGSAQLQVLDDVKARLGLLARLSDTKERRLRPPSELTSRVNAKDIPGALKNLEVSLPDRAADDVVLATNMISVGLDVDRLGLMAVMGQPQSSAEYIQATSRVGRKHPGLVVTMFNSSRSRDRSHFENFVPFHQAVYRSVEATSATPFAARARDRGLHGVLTSIVRLLFNDLAPSKGAGFADGQRHKLELAAAIIAQRARDCSEDGDETEQQLQGLVQEWLDVARSKPGLVYSLRDNWEASLLVDPAAMLVNPDIPDFAQGQVPWPTLQSLRDVDAESSLYQVVHRRER